MNEHRKPISLTRDQRRIVNRCGWYVKKGTRGWRCSAPFGHATPHQLLLNREVRDESEGYAL